MSLIPKTIQSAYCRFTCESRCLGCTRSNSSTVCMATSIDTNCTKIRNETIYEITMMRNTRDLRRRPNSSCASRKRVPKIATYQRVKNVEITQVPSSEAEGTLYIHPPSTTHPIPPRFSQPNPQNTVSRSSSHSTSLPTHRHAYHR